MKKCLLIILVGGLSILLLTTVSCKKKTKDPDYPQLIGTWSGTTSQACPVMLSVQNFDGELRITSVAMSYSFGPGSWDTIHSSNSDGLTALSGTVFKYYFDNSPPVVSFIGGTFRTDTLELNGNFQLTQVDNPGNQVSGTYTAYKH